MIRVVLFDLDGVIRHFDSRYVADIEVKYGLAAGALAATDDSASKLVGADRLRMHIQLFESVPRLRDRPKAAGVGLRDTGTAG